MDRAQLVGNKDAKRGLTVLIFRTLAVLSLLGIIGALMMRWSDEGELKYFIREGTVSAARVLDTSQQTNAIKWDNGKSGQVSYNFLRVATDPQGGLPYAEYAAAAAAGKPPSLSPPPTAPSDDHLRSIAVSDASMAKAAPGADVVVVTHRYDSSGGMLYSEIAGRDYTAYSVAMAVFAALAIGLWLVGSRLRRA
ncbi:MAG: hypothetical protein IE933_09250 [Sphingomonadales bacterium]|nr:hypothetical protein [Sphingomonadales bacterium]MBD3772876.1 hypothetical protein [Paracoccaceae bacterium]